MANTTLGIVGLALGIDRLTGRLGSIHRESKLTVWFAGHVTGLAGVDRVTRVGGGCRLDGFRGFDRIAGFGWKSGWFFAIGRRARRERSNRRVAAGYRYSTWRRRNPSWNSGRRGWWHAARRLGKPGGRRYGGWLTERRRNASWRRTECDAVGRRRRQRIYRWDTGWNGWHRYACRQ